MFIAIFIVFGFWAMIANSYADKGKEWVGNEGEVPFIISISLGNYGKDKSDYGVTAVQIQPYFHHFIIIAILFYSVYIRKRVMDLAGEIDEQTVTPADFTVMVYNIPKKITEEDLKDYFEKLLPNLEIKKVVYAYSISEIVHLLRIKSSLEDKKAFIEIFKKDYLKELKKTQEQAEAEGIDLSPPPDTCCY